METDWFEGLCLGHARNSNEILIGTREGVVRAWAIRKKPPEDQWDRELIKGMAGTPSKPNPRRPGLTIPITVNFDRQEEGEMPEECKAARNEHKPRSIYILPWMLESYGYSGDCPGCDSKRAGLSTSKPHSVNCRKRIEQEIANDPRGQEALERADERWKQWAAREAEMFMKEENDKPEETKYDLEERVGASCDQQTATNESRKEQASAGDSGQEAADFAPEVPVSMDESHSCPSAGVDAAPGGSL